MTVSENVRTKFMSVDVAQKLFAAGACFAFLASIVFPFYVFRGPFMEFPVSSVRDEYMWSYKLRSEDVLHLGVAEEYWFRGYWLGQTTTRYDNLSVVLPVMLFFQIMVVAVTAASIIIRSKVLYLVPIICCFCIIALMIYTDTVLSSQNLVSSLYQMGYWHTWLALVPLTGRFILTLKFEKT